SHRVEDREARAHGALGVVLACVRPAEVHEEAVAEILRDVAAEALDRPGRGLVVLRDHVAPLLGVELLSERRRAAEAAAEIRQLPPLARGGRRRVGRRRGRRAGRRGRLQSRAAATAELLAGIVRRATRGAGYGERGPAFRAEAPLGAVLVVAGR